MNSEISPPTPAQTSPFAAAYRVLNNAIATHAFPGCAFGVLARNQIVLHDALGRFTYDEASPSVTPETIYDLASVTKVVATTAMTMLLHQRGQLNLDTPLAKILPAFFAGRPQADYAHRVQLRHLLAHSSGLPGYIEFFRTAANASELLQACLKLPIQAEPGTHAEYSDPGFILLGKALESIVGESLATWVHREVIQPLEMDSTCFAPPSNLRSLVPPTEEDTTFRHRRIQGEVQDENAFLLHGIAGHAGLFSNVPGLLRFAAAVLNAPSTKTPPGDQTNLFQAQTVELFAERQPPQGSSRALGWDTPSENSSSGHRFSHRSIGHLGYSGCSLWIDLDAAIAVVLLSNRTWPDRSAAAAQLIRQVRPAFHDAIREAL